MTIEEAEAALRPWSRYKIKNVYDDSDFPTKAIFTLCPDFEYPNWDHETVGYFVKKMRHRCPDNSRFEGDLVGCGSTNITGPDDEGLYDCLNCGLWFRADAMAPRQKRKVKSI